MISVALCTYNGQHFLKQQVESILAQTVPVNEIIICDDCSTDGTQIIVNEFQMKNEGLFKIYTNPKNLGVIKNFEKAISLSSGDIIFLADQDDVWEINKVEKCMHFFEHNPQACGVFTNANIIEESGQLTNKTLWSFLGLENVKAQMQSSDLFKFMLLYGNIIAGNCLAITREAIDLIFPFKHIEGIWHDEWIAMKLAEHNKIHLLDEPLTRYRMHNNQQTKWLWSDREEKNKKRNSFIQKQAHLYPLDYYKHWKKRASAVQSFLKNGFEIDNRFIKEISAERKKGLLIHLKSNSFFKKKWLLFKLWLKGDENILLPDVVKY